MAEDCFFVTGGCGFIGGALINKLLKDTNAKVVNIDKLSYASNYLINDLHKDSNYHFFHGDINNRELISKIFNEFKPKYVLHLAAESHVDRSIDGPKAFIDSNILGTFNLLDLSLQYWNSLENKIKKNFRFLMVSTDEVYGSAERSIKFNEESPYNPSSPYSASKASSDFLTTAWYKTYKLPVIITNTSNNYGPMQFPEKLIPLTILKILNKDIIPVFGKGDQIRDWIYVDDHVEGLLFALKNGSVGEKYNIGSNCEKTNLEVVKKICEIFDKNYGGEDSNNLIEFVEDRPGHDFRYAIDNGKMLDMGWSPQFSWDKGIKLTIDWYLNNKEWINTIKNNNYKGERLGLRN